jgi:hypothetical protein
MCQMLIILSALRYRIDSMGVPALSVSIVFYTVWGAAMPQIDSIGVPAKNASIVFYTLWEDAML